MLQPNPYQNPDNPHLRYRQIAVQTATQDKLLLMLYDGVIRFVNLARECMKAKEIEAANTFIQKAESIITEFTVTLNMDYEIAKNLYRIYDFLNWRLTQANIKKDPAMLDVVVEILIDLRSTWAEAAHIVKVGESRFAGGVSFEG